MPQILPPQAFSILSPRRQPRGWVELARRLVAFQSGLQLLDGVKALHCGVHVARVPKVGKPARRMEGLGTTLGVSAGDKRGKKVRTTHKHRGREREREPVWCRVVGGGLTSHLSVGVALGPVLLSLRHDGVCRPPVGLRNGFGQGPSAAHHHKLLVRLHPDLQQQRSHERKQGGVWSSVRTRVQKKVEFAGVDPTPFECRVSSIPWSSPSRPLVFPP